MPICASFDKCKIVSGQSNSKLTYWNNLFVNCQFYSVIYQVMNVQKLSKKFVVIDTNLLLPQHQITFGKLVFQALLSARGEVGQIM